MPQRQINNWIDLLVRDLGRRALSIAANGTSSTTLNKGMQLLRPSIYQSDVFIPHYWAVFVHDGSRAVQDQLMIWYKNPRNDPRLRPNRPIRQSQVKRLTRSEFKFARDNGLIIVTTQRKAVKGRFFFDNRGNMRPLSEYVHTEAPKRFSELVRREFRALGVGKTLTL